MQAIILNGEWRFLPTSADDLTNYVQTGDPMRWQTIQIPQHFEQSGVVWLYRQFEMPANDECSVWWLEFGGVDYDCDVWINGQSVGAHTGYFGKFRFDVTSAIAMGTNHLMVRVASPTNANSLQTAIKGVLGNTIGIWADVVLSPYECDDAPSEEDWYEPLAEPIVQVEAHSGRWMRDSTPFFPRGCTYLPAQQIGEITREMFEHDVALMKDAHLNIVRVYAHVLSPLFYEVCDDMGMLVWQDFPLYGGYQDTPEFHKEALRQVREMVLQLGHHPCIAVWGIHTASPWTVENTRQNHQLDEKLAATVRELDPARHVYLGEQDDVLIETPSFPLYFETPVHDVPVLYGAPAPPSPAGKEIPAIVESQQLQSSIIKSTTEFYRTRKDQGVHGLFYHAFVDEVTGSQFGVVDREREPKLGYAALKSAMQPLLPIAELSPDQLDQLPAGESVHFAVSVVNDLPEKVQGWVCKISMTGWIPSSELGGETTYMHHWSHVFNGVEIEPCSKITLGTVTIPPLPSRNLTYQLVLQLFNLDDEHRRSAVNTYVVQVVE